MAGKYASKCLKLGPKILKQVWAKGWSQRRLASEFPDQSVSTVNRWTNDPESQLAQSCRALLQLAETFNCSIDYLVRDEVDDPAGGLLNSRQRYLLDLAERVGIDEAIDRIIGAPGRPQASPEQIPPANVESRPRGRKG